MNEETFNLSLRKFLKKVGVTSQREIEQAVRDALENGQLQGSETLPIKVKLEFEPMDEPMEISGDIKLS